MTLQHEIALFKLALSFLTRIPIHIDDYSDDKLNKASGYFPLVGVFIGCLLGLCVYLLQLVLPISVSVVLVIIIGLLLTGGFHEDGLADIADGFGGAFDAHRKLEIMKDSRLGTYGTLALISLFAIKYQTLVATSHIVMALIAAHGISRAFATSIIGTCPYVTEDTISKVKPIAKQLPSSAQNRLWLTFCVLCAVLFLYGMSLLQLIALIVTCFAVRSALTSWFKKHINGYTGDCLGAAQQIFEVLIYCLILLFLD